MAPSTKLAFALLTAAILLAGPRGDCPWAMKTASTPIGHCDQTHSPSVPQDCSAPGCIFLDTQNTPAQLTQLDPTSDGSEFVNSGSPSGTATAVAPNVTPSGFTERGRLTALHQFLI